MPLENNQAAHHRRVLCSLIISPGRANVLLSLFNLAVVIFSPFAVNYDGISFEIIEEEKKPRENDNPACGLMGGKYDGGHWAGVMEKSGGKLPSVRKGW